MQLPLSSPLCLSSENVCARLPDLPVFTAPTATLCFNPIQALLNGLFSFPQKGHDCRLVLR